MQYLRSVLDSLLAGVPDVIVALLYLVIALIVASAMKKLVISLGWRLGLDRLAERAGHSEGGIQQGDVLEPLGKIVYFLVFILFLPAILERLHIQGVSAPLVAMTTTVIGYLPNLLACAILIAVGVFIARFVRQILLALLKKANIDRLQVKAGIQMKKDTVRLSSMLANLVYTLILIVTAVAALEALNIDAISIPALEMLSAIIGMLPNIFVAVVLVAIGVVLSRIVGAMLSDLLAGTGVNGLIRQIFNDTENKYAKVKLSKIISTIAQVIIVLFFVVEAVSVLNLAVLREVGAAVIGYLPALLSGVVILGAGFLLASWVAALIIKYAPGSRVLAGIIKYAIILVIVFMTLNQLGVAPFIVNTTFIVILGALAVASAIAFGIGGRNFAAKVLDKIKLDKDDRNYY